MRISSLLLAQLAFVSVLVPSASAVAAASPRAHYLVISLKDGKASIVHSELVRLQAPLQSLSPTEVATRLARRQRDRRTYRVTVKNSRRSVVHQDIVEAPLWLRGEFHGQSSLFTRAEIEGQLHPLDSSLLALRIPETPGGTLTLDAGASSRTKGLTLEIGDGRDSSSQVGESAAQPLPDWSNGDSANRVDLLILGDGYQKTERAKFESDASSLVASFFSITPYAEYRNYVNVWTLFVASAESGADQPPYDPQCAQYAMVQSCCGDAGADAQPSRFVDTAFDATFCSYNTQRLLTVNLEKVLVAAAAAPVWDKMMLLVNDRTYGGSGGAVAVVSTNDLAVEVAQHEYGHSFTYLADEYETAYPGYPVCSDVSGAVACEANVTDESDAERVKWNHWITPVHGFPSLLEPVSATDAGLWEGARFLASGMFRQCYYGLMRALGAPFGDVASEAYAIQLYQGAWGTPAQGIDNIEPGSESPSPGSVSTGVSPWFSARVLGPIGGPPLAVTWSVDGVPVESSTATTGSTIAYQLQQPSGTYALDLEIRDTSPILHPRTQPLVASRRNWKVTTTSCGNGSVDPGEQCDDGGSAAGDGCSATCRVEACFECADEPSVCTEISVCVSGDGCCGALCRQDDDSDCPILISGKSLMVKDGSDPKRRKINFQSKDPRIRVAAAPELDPTVNGASLQLFNEETGQSLCLILPRDYWTAKGTTYSYRDRKNLAGPCKSAALANGSLFKASCRSQHSTIDYGLVIPPPQSLTVIFQSGAARYCTVFGGDITARGTLDPVTGRARGQLRAKQAPEPRSCPMPRDRCP